MKKDLLLILFLIAPLESIHAASQQEIDEVEEAISRQTSAGATNLRHCARLSFPGTDRMIITNICRINIYTEWSDDRGTHVTASGSGRSIEVGRYHGRPRIDRVSRQ